MTSRDHPLFPNEGNAGDPTLSRSSSDTNRELAARLSGGTLLIRGTKGTGSGVMIGSRVLTAFHVVQDSDELSAALGRQRSEVRFLAASPAYDVAILEVTDLATLADVTRFVPSSGGYVGDTIWTCGYPYGLTVPVVRKGAIAATLTPNVATVVDRPMFMMDNIESERHWIDVPVFPGNSGGPVIDEQGDVIGLMLETHFVGTDDRPIHLDLGVAVRLGMGLSLTGLDGFLG